MKKKLIPMIIGLIILIIGVAVVGVLLNKEDNPEKEANLVKDALKKEQDFLSIKELYVDYVDVKAYEGYSGYNWIEATKSLNIKGRMVKGYVAEEYSDFSNDALILADDGTLYYKFSNDDDGDEYAIIKYEEKYKEKVKRVGVSLENPGGECEPVSGFVIDTPSGVKEIERNYETGAVSIKKVTNTYTFQHPSCYGREGGATINYLNVYNDLSIGYRNKEIKVKDKKTKKNLEVKALIFLDGKDKEKYYAVTTDDVLYIIDKNIEHVDSLVKLDKFEVTEHQTKGEYPEKYYSIKMVYQDIELDFSEPGSEEES